MPSSEEFKSKKPSYTIELNGHFGSGKTRAGLTFPKCYVICCDPSGLDILYQAQNEELLKNLVWYEYIHNSSTKELKELFDANGRIYKILDHARQLAESGEIETLVLDGFTYFTDMVWQRICEFEEVRSPTTQGLDTQAMYRNLGLWLQRFVASDLLTLSTRANLNVVLTCHLKRLSQDEIQGNTDKKTGRHRPGRIIQETDVAPYIEGGFRNKIEGLVGASIYLETQIARADNGHVKAGDTLFKAICRPAVGLNTIVNAKNRYGLPARIDLTDKSLYQALVEFGKETKA